MLIRMEVGDSLLLEVDGHRVIVEAKLSCTTYTVGADTADPSAVSLELVGDNCNLEGHLPGLYELVPLAGDQVIKSKIVEDDPTCPGTFRIVCVLGDDTRIIPRGGDKLPEEDAYSSLGRVVMTDNGAEVR